MQHDYVEEGGAEPAPSLTSALRPALSTPTYLKDRSNVSYAILLPALDFASESYLPSKNNFLFLYILFSLFSLQD